MHKKYPRHFSQENVKNNNGYPKYHRRDDGIVALKGMHQFDNRDVVPYKHFLLLKYSSHISVEICSSVCLVKCLFKFLCERCDSVSMQFVRSIDYNRQLRYDETTAYSNMQYVSSREHLAPSSKTPMMEYMQALEANAALRAIDDILRRNGLDCRSMSLPIPDNLCIKPVHLSLIHI